MKRIILILFMFLAKNSFAQSVEELAKQANELENGKKYNEAIVLYGKILKLDTAHYESYVNRGLLFEKQDKIQEAYDDYTKAISIHSDSALAYHYRAILLYRMTYSDEAISDNTKALELANNDSLRLICFSNRGSARQQKRDFQGAFEDYTRAYLLDTNSIATLNNMATTLDELGGAKKPSIILKK